MTYPDWRDDAACADAPDYFHAPEHETATARAAREAAALAYCDRCEVVAQCARAVMADRDLYTYAIAGNQTPAMRGIKNSSPIRRVDDDTKASIRAQYVAGIPTARIAREHNIRTGRVSHICADLRAERYATLGRTTA